MKLLIPYGFSSDLYLAKAAQAMGHELHFMYDDPKRCAAFDMFKADGWARIKSHYETGLSTQDYYRWYQEQLVEYITANEIDAILPSSSMDSVMNEVAAANDYFGMPGIRREHAGAFRDKTVYIPLLEQCGVAVPKTYSIVEPTEEPVYDDLQYPCIAKPGLGNGGVGIFIAQNYTQLLWFFGPSEKVEDFSEEALFYQDKDFAGEPKSYLHFGYNGRYLVQEFLEGPCISLAGTAVGGQLRLDLVYDIGVTPPPHCSEISFAWPSEHAGAQEAALSCVDSLEKALNFPDGAFMVDAIWKDGQLYVVDISCRMSTSGTKMLYHAGMRDLSYPKNVIEALLDGTLGPETEPTVPVYYSFIPFPKGELQNVEYPDPVVMSGNNTYIIEREKLADERVFEMRNDLQVADRGWIVVESPGGSRQEAENLARSYIDNIKYDILNIGNQVEN